MEEIDKPNIDCDHCGVTREGGMYPHNMTEERWRNELAARAMDKCTWIMDDHKDFAKWCYERAKAMIEEGKKEVKK